MAITDTDNILVLRHRESCQGPDDPRRLFEVLRTAAEGMARGCRSRFRKLLPLQEDLDVPQPGPTLTLYVTALRRYAMALTGNRDEADDLVQECLTRAIARTKVWSRIDNVRAYLFTILHNVHVDRVARGRRSATVVPLDVMENKLFERPLQEDALRLRDLERALRVLPDDYRQVVLLVGLEGLSYRDAAATLGIPVGTVMSRLSRGRDALRELMGTESHNNLRIVK